MLNPVATTALLVAALRAEESEKPSPLFRDPLAVRLAGDAGQGALVRYRTALGESIPIIEVRTRWLDQALLRALEPGIRQVVIVAAGMDARAFRLPLPAAVRIFEIDQPALLAVKNKVLQGEQPHCARHTIACDLTGDWPSALAAEGFDPALPSVFLSEGLLQYLDRATVEGLFARIDALAARGSSLLFDVVGAALLTSEALEPLLSYMRALGAPWTFGSDEPNALITKHGWTSEVSDAAAIGYAWGRWPTPAVPAHVQGVPRGYFVEAHKLESRRP